MSSEKRGVLLVLSAPSGAGKTTLAHRLLAAEGGEFSVSVTTRAPRGAEVDGRDYHFVSRERFDIMVSNGELAEWAEVHGNRYGTPRPPVEAALREGRLLVFDIDVQGGEQIKARYPDAVTVLVLPPSMAELERRLRDRKTDSEAVIAGRLDAARHEVRRGSNYDFWVVNDGLETALRDLVAIVRAARLRKGWLDLPALFP
jgi:guanylate kinase